MPQSRRRWTPTFGDAANAPAATGRSSRCGSSCGTCPPIPRPRNCSRESSPRSRTEDRDVRADFLRGGADATKPFLSRFRIPIEAAAVILLFASVYWYQRSPATAVRLPSGLSADLSSETAKVTSSRPAAERKDVVKGSPPGIRSPGVKPKAPGEAAPSAAKPRTWTEADLPSVPAIRASTDSERIVPVAPPPGPTADPAAAEAPAFGERRRPDGKEARSPPVSFLRSAAVPPSPPLAVWAGHRRGREPGEP